MASVGLLATVFDSHNQTFSTTFLELLLCISSSESCKAYERIFDAWALSLQLCVDVTDPCSLVDEVHCDLALGIRAAIRSRFPSCRICLDWAHLVAAVRRTKCPDNEACTFFCLGVSVATKRTRRRYMIPVCGFLSPPHYPLLQ